MNCLETNEHGNRNLLHWHFLYRHNCQIYRVSALLVHCRHYFFEYLMNSKGDYAWFLPVAAHRVCLPRGRLSVGHNGSVKSVEIVDDHRTGYVIENVLSGTVHAEYAGWW